MKLGGAWMLLLAVLVMTAHGEQPNEDIKVDTGLDEAQQKLLVTEKEEATVSDEEEPEETTENQEETQADPNVSFQVTYKTPVPSGDVYFAETFDDGLLTRWQQSKTMKEDADENIAKYDGKWAVEQLLENKIPGDLGLVLKSRAKHHAIAALLDKPFVFSNEPLVVQYEVNFQEGIDCGGAYIKLLSDSRNLNLEQFNDRTPYSIMFGPDKCGEDYKLHFIFRHKNPLNKDMEEKHAKRPDVDLKKFYTDKKTHLYTLVLNPDNSYELFIDQSSVSRGNLLQDVVPPVNPPKEIEDPTDSKPDDWDEKPKIPDPEALKPDDWDESAPVKIEDPDALKPEGWLDDEPEFVSDPTAEKPDDWDDEMDGEWEAPQIPNPTCETAPGCGDWKRPMINNPEYKGKWKAPLVDNPNYQGVWKPRKINNPDYFEDLQPFKMTPFRAVGLELWSMTSDIYFDNFIITSHKEVADRWASDSWGLKKLVASANEPGIWAQLLAAAEERPWLWVVYILTISLPIGLAVLFCWPKKADDEYEYKRSDLPKGENEEEEEEEQEGAAVDEEEKAAEATEETPATEETKEEDAKNNAAGDNLDASDEEAEENPEEEEVGDSETLEDEIKDTGDESHKQAVRKRRVRKE